MKLPRHELDEIRARTELAQERLHGAWVFATGMTGPFGFWLVSALDYLRATVGTDVRLDLLSRDPDAFFTRYPWCRELTWLRIISGDVRSTGLQRHPYTHVISGAATTASETFTGQSPLQKFSTVVDGTRNLLASLDPSHECRIVFISSGSTCGTSLMPPGDPIPEAWPETPPMLPGATLGHAKRAAEFATFIHGDAYPNHPVSIVRCFSFSGPAMPLDLHYAIGNFLKAALSGQPIVVQGDGSAVRSYMHMGDMTAWLLQALTAAPAGQILNFGSEVGISVLELAKVVKRVSGTGAEIQVLNTDDARFSTSAAPHYVPSTSTTRALLQVGEWTPLEESLKRWLYFLRP